MEKIQLGKTEVQVSKLIQGSWIMGKDYWGGADDEESVQALLAAYENGINTFDTAYIYGKGYAEELMGRTLKPMRQDCVYISKLWKTYMTKETAGPALEDALRRLQTDYLDVFFIHYPSDVGVPIEETMTEMMRFKKEGKIRAIGLSNFSLEQMKEAAKYGDVDLIQPCYSMLWRFIDTEILPYCIEHNIATIPYSPLAQGLLTGCITRDQKFAEGDARPGTPLYQPENFSRALEVTEVVKQVAARYGKTPAQVALAWLMQVPGITAPIVGASNRQQVEDNMGSLGWSIEAADLAILNQASEAFAYSLPNYKNLFDKTVVEQ